MQEPSELTASCAVAGAIGFWELARRDPKRIAIIDRRGACMTFGELSSCVDLISETLCAAGVSRGAVVAAMIPNDPVFLAVQLAVLQLGAYFSFFNSQATAEDYEFVLNDSLLI